MDILITGSTGMLGQALMKESQQRHFQTTGLASKNTDLNIDITDTDILVKKLKDIRPQVIINAAAIVSHKRCEENPEQATNTNAKAVSVLAEIAKDIGCYFIQISTDHFFTNDKDRKHDEDHPVTLLNEYARTKYEGEKFALENPQALVVRTNIVGFRNFTPQQPSFIEWIIMNRKNRQPITLFDDYFTSSIDITTFVCILFDLFKQRPHGRLNIASQQVSSKKEFIEELCHEFQFDLDGAITGSVKTLQTPMRAESLGLDVSQAESLLGCSLPDRHQVIANLQIEYKALGYEL
ncbi:sugar nucleotide-binding protein [PVC group bacterium]|nr:sugar nucleotide-binding protein [PVC group bacterium]